MVTTSQIYQVIFISVQLGLHDTPYLVLGVLWLLFCKPLWIDWFATGISKGEIRCLRQEAGAFYFSFNNVMHVPLILRFHGGWLFPDGLKFNESTDDSQVARSSGAKAMFSPTGSTIVRGRPNSVCSRAKQ